jgi:hypothetical protein
VKLEFGAITERLESQDLQLFEFEQSDSFVKRTSLARGLYLRWLECAANARFDSLLTAKVPRWSFHWMTSARSRTSPTTLTNSNGECGDGSSNKTPHIGVPVRAPPLVAHIPQLLRAKCR